MIENYTKYSDQWFLEKYFRYGSVEAAILKEPLMPISIASFHRIIAKCGVIASPGRHSNFNEMLTFFRLHANSPYLPITSLYQKMPRTFKTSAVTLHRIYGAFSRNITRRYATGLAITSDQDHSRFLMGRETYSNSIYGRKAGMWTVPMTFSKKGEANIDSVFRVLQQEVSVNKTLSGEFSSKSSLYKKLKETKPLFIVDVLDVQLSVYYLHLPIIYLKEFSSFKLGEHCFMTMKEILSIDNDLLRPGMRSVVKVASKNISALKEGRYRTSL